MGRVASAIRTSWEWVTKSRYVCYLERELERTREELKLWQEAYVQREGYPAVHGHPKELPKLKARMTPSQYRAEAERLTRHEEKKPE